jgi:hypothetical protein
LINPDYLHIGEGREPSKPDLEFISVMAGLAAIARARASIRGDRIRAAATRRSVLKLVAKHLISHVAF